MPAAGERLTRLTELGFTLPNPPQPLGRDSHVLRLRPRQPRLRPGRACGGQDQESEDRPLKEPSRGTLFRARRGTTHHAPLRIRVSGSSWETSRFRSGSSGCSPPWSATTFARLNSHACRSPASTCFFSAIPAPPCGQEGSGRIHCPYVTSFRRQPQEDRLVPIRTRCLVLPLLAGSGLPCRPRIRRSSVSSPRWCKSNCRGEGPQGWRRGREAGLHRRQDH